MISLHKQRGASMYSMMIVGALVIYFAISAVKLGPVYLDDYQVKQVLEKAAREVSGGMVTKSLVRDTIDKGFQMNNLGSLKAKQVEVLEEAGGTTLVLDYEVRVAMFYNVDAVLSFSHRVPINK